MTALWIIFILLIAFGLLYLGGMVGLSIILWIYAEDPEYWNKKVQPILTDLRDWVDAGNSLWKYPKDRIDKIL